MTTGVQVSTPCNLLPWDSEFFQFRIGRVCADTLDDTHAKEIEEWSNAERVRCLYFLARADRYTITKTAERYGFGLVDIRVTFERIARGAKVPAGHQPSPGLAIRPFQAEDLPALEAIAAEAHTDTRFFADPHFPRHVAQRLYATWIKLDCQGRAQQVLVASTFGGEAVGYVSCHLNPKDGAGQIGLIGIRADARGKGLGKSLVWSALDWFKTQEAPLVTVVTQGRNVLAQRLYQRCGFFTSDVRLWYHKWYPISRSENA